MPIPIHTSADFKQMHKSGKIAAEILDFITPYVLPGTSTEKLNKLCHDEIIRRKCKPAPLGYRGFPKSICTSIGKVVCHGIPSDDMILREGDIMNIDVTVITEEGWHGDTSRMYYVGEPTERAKELCEFTYEVLMASIKAVYPGEPVYLIGKTIEKMAKKEGFSVVEDFCGHGLGKVFHNEPHVFHYFNPTYDIKLKPGMFFTIEPMINIGTHKTKVLKDNWTAVTRDGSLSAQFEHSLGVTENGVEIFTTSPKNLHCPPYNISD